MNRIVFTFLKRSSADFVDVADYNKSSVKTSSFFLIKLYLRERLVARSLFLS